MGGVQTVAFRNGFNICCHWFCYLQFLDCLTALYMPLLYKHKPYKMVFYKIVKKISG
jgi:hypothetical protein